MDIASALGMFVSPNFFLFIFFFISLRSNWTLSTSTCLWAGVLHLKWFSPSTRACKIYHVLPTSCAQDKYLARKWCRKIFWLCSTSRGGKRTSTLSSWLQRTEGDTIFFLKGHCVFWRGTLKLWLSHNFTLSMSSLGKSLFFSTPEYIRGFYGLKLERWRGLKNINKVKQNPQNYRMHH